jgi:hypothetical protein
MAKPTEPWRTPVTPAMVDMDRLFGSRLARLIEDWADTAKHADVEDKAIVKILVTGLLYEVIQGTTALGMDETDYVQFCVAARRAMARAVAKVSGPTRTA